MRIIKFIAAGLFCAGLVLSGGCPDMNIPGGASTSSTAPMVPPDTNQCHSGCEALARLTGRDGKPGCEESRPLELPGGGSMTCEQWCTGEQKLGRELSPSCWKNVTKCQDVETVRKQSQPCTDAGVPVNKIPVPPSTSKH